VGPESVEVRARVLAVGGRLATTLIVTGYPAEVTPGWLDPLLTYPGRLDVAVHIEPVPSAVAAAGLRKQRARLESARRHGHDHGRLDDPLTEAAAADAADIAHRLARGEGKLFRVGLYLTVHATSEDELADEAATVRAVAESLLVSTVSATYRSLPGWLATTPLGLDTLRVRRTMDTAALAACFPFSSPDLPATGARGDGQGGVLYGVNNTSGSLLLWDRFAQDNHNSVTLARSGSGKSYLTKLEVLRQLFTGTEAAVIDPEDEYVRLAEAAGGTVIRPGAPGVRINPLDLPDTNGDSDGLTRRVLFAHTFLAVLLGTGLTPDERAVLDRVLLAVYRQAGITADPRTWARPAPLLRDLATALAADPAEVAGSLAARLDPYVTGSHKELFDGPTTTRPDGHLVVYALRALPEELKMAGMLLVLDALWRRVASGPRRRRLIVVDEAWLLMRDGHGARFLFRMAKAARKHWAGLAVVTQDADDVLGSDLGRAVVANAATQILLRQAPQTLDQVTEAFHLSGGERQFLLTAPRGTALLLSGRAKAAFTPVASPEEHRLVTSDPAELPGQKEEDEEEGDAEPADPYGLPDLDAGTLPAFGQLSNPAAFCDLPDLAGGAE
jgi:type IV secretory pathway VirB4 component